MKTKLLGTVFGVFILLQGAVAQDHSGHDMKMNMNMDHDKGMVKKFEVSTDFQKQLNTVYQASLGLTDAFIASDASATKEKAGAMLESLDKVDMTLVKDDAHMAWMKYKKSLSDGLNKIMASGDLESQRKSYSFVNETLYKAIKTFGVGETVYYNYCPMFKANWLSSTKEISNPYYGEKMSKCGSTKEVLN